MIIVLGDVEVRPEHIDQALVLSRAHVERSRDEHGCVSHDVLIDPAQPNRLVFVERWEDRAALDRHFEVPDSIAFARSLTDLAATPPRIQILPIVAR